MIQQKILILIIQRQKRRKIFIFFKRKNAIPDIKKKLMRIEFNNHKEKKEEINFMIIIMNIQKFFDRLSTQIWKIPNHPFFRQFEQQVEQKEEDFSKLFPQKPVIYQPTQIQLEQRLKIKQKQATSFIQEQNNKMTNIQIVVDSTKFRNYAHIFNSQRGICKKCPPPACTGYNSNCDISKQLFLCDSCKCPMDYHYFLRQRQAFSDLIFDKIYHVQMKQKYLRCDFSVIMFQLTQKFNYSQLTMDLNSYGYSILSNYEQKIQIMKQKLKKKSLFSINNLITDKQNLQKWILLFQITYYNKKIKEKIQSDFIKVYQKVSQKINKLIPYTNNNVAIFLIKFQKWKGIQQIVKKFNLLYNSKGQYNSIIDSQIFFPQFYTLSFYQFHTPQIQNQGILNDFLNYNNYYKFKQKIDQINIFSPITRVHSLLTSKVGSIDIGSISTFKKKVQLKGKSQRAVLILRPLVIKAGIDQPFINIFRINNLLILNRKFVRLSNEEALFLSKLQNIPKYSWENYCRMMTSGFCEVVLLSGMMANKKLQGLTFCPSVTQRSNIFVHNTILHDVYDFGIFVSTKNMIDLQKICQSKLAVSLRDSLAKTILSDQFDYAVIRIPNWFTQQCVSMFMQQFANFSEAYLILKPDFIQKYQQLISYIQENGFVILMKNIIIPNLSLVNFLLKEICKYDQKINPKILEKWVEHKIQILCVTKVAGQQECRLIFGKNMVEDQQPALLAFTQQSRNLCRGLLADVLNNIDNSIVNRHKLKHKDKSIFYQFIAGTILGTQIISVQNNLLNTKLGLYLFSTNNEDNCRLLSWYYFQVSKINPHYVPLVYKYRKFNKLVVELTQFIGGKYNAEIEKMSQDIKSKKNEFIFQVWGKKLKKFMDDLIELGKSIKIEGWGNISQNKILQGQIENSNIITHQIKKYRNIINNCFDQAESDKKIRASEILQEILKSDTFKHIRSQKQKTIIPKLQGQKLRAVTNGFQIQKYRIYQYQQVDMQYELFNKNDKKYLTSYYFYDCLPYINSSYRLFCHLYDILYKDRSKILVHFLREIKDQSIKFEINPYKAELFLFYLQSIEMDFKSIKQFKGSEITRNKSIYDNFNNLFHEARFHETGQKQLERFKFIPRNKYYNYLDEKDFGKQEIEKKKLHDDIPNKQFSILYDGSDRLMNEWAQLQTLKIRQKYNIKGREGVNVLKNIKDITMQNRMKQLTKKEIDKLNKMNKPRSLIDDAIDKQINKFKQFKKQL